LLNRAFNVIKGHPYWCRVSSYCAIMSTLILKLTKMLQLETCKFVDFNHPTPRFDDSSPINELLLLLLLYEVTTEAVCVQSLSTEVDTRSVNLAAIHNQAATPSSDSVDVANTQPISVSTPLLLLSHRVIYKKLSYRRETAPQLPTWRGLSPPVHSPSPGPPLWIHFAYGRIRNPQ